MELRASLAKFKKKLLDLDTCLNRDRYRKEVLPFSNITNEHRLANEPQCDAPLATSYHSVIRRVAVEKI